MPSQAQLEFQQIKVIDSLLSHAILLTCLCCLLRDSWGLRHIAKSDTKTVWSEVISGEVNLLINLHLFSRCCLHTSVHLAFNFGLERVACAPSID